MAFSTPSSHDKATLLSVPDTGVPEHALPLQGTVLSELSPVEKQTTDQPADSLVQAALQTANDLAGASPQKRAEVLYQQGMLLHFKKRFSQAIDVMEKAHDEYASVYHVIGQLSCLTELAWIKFNDVANDSQKAKLAFSQALQLSEELSRSPHLALADLHNIQARLIHYLGLMEYRQGHYGQAVERLRHALDLARFGELDWAKIQDSLGVHYERMGDFHRAEHTLKQALAKKEHLAIPHEMAITTQILSRLYTIQERYTDAYEMMERSLALCESLEDSKRATNLKNSRVKLLIQQNRITEAEQAIDTLQQSLEHNPLLTKELGITLFLKTAVLFQRQQSEAALALMDQRVIPLMEQTHYQKGLGKCYRLKGRLLGDTGQFHTALEFMSEALSLFKQLHLVDELVKTHLEWGKLYLEQDQPQLALERFLEGLRLCEDNGLRFLSVHLEDEIYRTDITQWRYIVDRRARYEKIFPASAVTALSPLALPDLPALDAEWQSDTIALDNTSGIKTKALVSLLRLAQAIAGVSDLDQLLALVTEETKKALDCDRCTVFIFDPDRNELWSRVASGLSQREEIRFPAHLGIAGYVCKTGEVINIADAYSDPRFNKDVDKKTGYHTRHILCVPIVNRNNQIVGVFQVLNKEVGHFTAEDEELLMAIASQAGVSIENAQMAQDKELAFKSFVRTLSSTIDARDPITAGHSERVALYAGVMGEQMSLSHSDLEILTYASLLHDIGKIGIREDVLTKEGRLTEQEYKHIQKHAEYTYDILQNIHFERHLHSVPEVAASHHEKVDGSGYFRGLKGQEIPFLGRVLALCDVFDAITSRRHYRNRMPFERVLKIIRKDTNSHFDADCVNSFFDVPLIKIARILAVDEHDLANFPEGVDKLERQQILKALDPLATVSEYWTLLHKPKEHYTVGERTVMEAFDSIYRMMTLDEHLD